ncbi:MAG: GNAT family N-acetyltransferase [Chloroflexi bacterium]|nr:GNAT family N-acetyltransferase [Chloroflexota bacterium]
MNLRICSRVEIGVTERSVLAPLFERNKYDRVLIDSVLEGHFGVSYADSGVKPSVARLDSGAFTMLGGNPNSATLRALLQHSPIHYVTPESDEWRRVLRDEFGDRIPALSFTEFSSRSLDENHLAKLTQDLPTGFELKRVDAQLAERLPSDTGNEYFFENFHSVEDFLSRGIGYCVVYKNRIVSAATSMAMCTTAIDIEIETSPDFRRRGLGTVVGARLVLHCLENGMEPKWLAANPISERLALKLGYSKSGTYETFEIRS